MQKTAGDFPGGLYLWQGEMTLSGFEGLHVVLCTVVRSLLKHSGYFYARMV